jgi:hypothetical protein
MAAITHPNLSDGSSFEQLRLHAGLTPVACAQEFAMPLAQVLDWDSGASRPPLHILRTLEVMAKFADPRKPAATNSGKVAKDDAPNQTTAASDSESRTPKKVSRSKAVSDPDRLIKSKQRVADHGEVFTPPWLVEKMLDMVKGETERIDSRFLEPACGSGNFLVPILQRKLAAVETKYGKSDFEKRHYALVGLTCCYGIELLADNIIECRANMLEVFAAYLNLDEADEMYRAAAHILSLNLIQGDAMTMRDHAGDPITVVEWGYIGKGKFQRRDFRLDVLTGMSAFREEATLFAHLGEHDIFRPTGTYPPMTVRELAMADNNEAI